MPPPQQGQAAGGEEGREEEQEEAELETAADGSQLSRDLVQFLLSGQSLQGQLELTRSITAKVGAGGASGGISNAAAALLEKLKLEVQREQQQQQQQQQQQLLLLLVAGAPGGPPGCYGGGIIVIFIILRAKTSKTDTSPVCPVLGTCWGRNLQGCTAECSSRRIMQPATPTHRRRCRQRGSRHKR